jgi:hypothetical protein
MGMNASTRRNLGHRGSHPQVPAEELRVGDLVRCHISATDPWRTITAIRPYNGPLRDIVFGIAETCDGGFSLCKGQPWEVSRG